MTTGSRRLSRDTNWRIPRNYTSVNFGQGFPKQARMSMRYWDNITVSSTTGSVGLWNFRANDVYDPNATGTGHQPMYFDQMMAIYNHFVVVGSKISVFPSYGGANTTPYAMVIMFNDDLTSPSLSSLFAAIENSKSKFVINAPQADGKMLSMGYSARSTFGGDPLAMSQLQGTASASPSETSVFTIAMQPSDLASTLDVYVQVLIEYEVVFRELKDIATS